MTQSFPRLGQIEDQRHDEVLLNDVLRENVEVEHGVMAEEHQKGAGTFLNRMVLISS